MRKLTVLLKAVGLRAPRVLNPSGQAQVLTNCFGLSSRLSFELQYLGRVHSRITRMSHSVFRWQIKPADCRSPGKNTKEDRKLEEVML